MRRSRLEVRRGGIREEGAARDVGSEAFTVRRRDRTFPFWSIGAALAAAGFFGALAIAGHYTFPIRVLFRKVEISYYFADLTGGLPASRGALCFTTDHFFRESLSEPL